MYRKKTISRITHNLYKNQQKKNRVNCAMPGKIGQQQNAKKCPIAPIISIPAFNQDRPLGIKSYLIIKGAMIRVLGTNLKNKTSSTVKLVLTENLVATIKTAQIETVIKATINPKYRRSKLSMSYFYIYSAIFLGLFLKLVVLEWLKTPYSEVFNY